MRWLKGLISLLLVVVAAGVVLSTALSDHSDDYGQVSLPSGGVLQLPKGSVTIFFNQLGDNSDPIQQSSVPISFQVVPAGGGPALPLQAVDSQTPAAGVERSASVGELGAIAKLNIPTAGAYVISGTTSAAPGTSFLKFGTNAGAALAHRWKLLAGLIGAALLLMLIPVPKGRRHWEDEHQTPTGWSSDSRAPYAG
jgi:hypothetical protein